MAVLSNEMIRGIRSVADEYVRRERERLVRVNAVPPVTPRAPRVRND